MQIRVIGVKADRIEKARDDNVYYTYRDTMVPMERVRYKTKIPLNLPYSFAFTLSETENTNIIDITLRMISVNEV